MVTIAVKKITYRSVKIFFDELVYVGEGQLGVYRPPGGSENVFLEQGVDESILRLFPARVNGLRPGLGALSLALARGLSLHFPSHVFSGPLGSGRPSDLGWGVGV